MFNAQLLFGSSTTSLKVYSPWFPRQGDYLRATAEVVALSATSGVTLVVKVFTKNKEDTGDGTAVTGSISLSAAERGDQEFTSLKELVRYEFDAQCSASNWLLFRMLAPVWFDAVKA